MNADKKINVNDPEHDDEVLAELRQSREEFAARFNYDFNAIGRYLREQERRHPPGRVVSVPVHDGAHSVVEPLPQLEEVTECQTQHRAR
jgi:hypothetical protein